MITVRVSPAYDFRARAVVSRPQGFSEVVTELNGLKIPRIKPFPRPASKEKAINRALRATIRNTVYR